MAIIRTKHDRENPYVVINKKSLWDESLSLEAAGLWARMLSKPDDWEICAEQMAKACRTNYRRMLKILEELITAGYVIRKQEMPKGQRGFCKVVYEVYEFKIIFTHVDFTLGVGASDVNMTSNKERDNQVKKNTEDPPHTPPLKDGGGEPPATPEEDFQIDERIKNRKVKKPIPNMKGYRLEVLKDIRAQTKSAQLEASRAALRRHAVHPYDGKTVKGFYISVYDDRVEIYHGQTTKIVYYNSEDEVWNKYLGFLK